MQRTTIVAPEQLLERLLGMAAERGTSMADLIREALEEKVSADPTRPTLPVSVSSGRQRSISPVLVEVDYWIRQRLHAGLLSTGIQVSGNRSCRNRVALLRVLCL